MTCIYCSIIACSSNITCQYVILKANGSIYIEGENIKLIPGELIVQHWRTSEFNDSDKDSRLEIAFEAMKGATRVTIRHFMLPAHGMQYQSGWVENYFDPMKTYFSSL